MYLNINYSIGRPVALIILIILCFTGLRTVQADNVTAKFENFAQQCMNPMVVEPDNYPEETGNLNATIETCLAENPETVFMLQRDAVYWIDGSIVIDDFKLHLKAEEGEGHLPIIRPANTTDRLITSSNDFTFEGIYLLGVNENGDLNHQVSHSGERNRIIFDGGAMAGSSSTSFILSGANNSLFVTNSIFANAGREHWDFGRFINKSQDQDTIWVENSTVYNFIHSLLMGSGDVDYLHFDHNTAINMGSNIRSEGSQEVTITNNLFLNLSLRGESGIITTSSTGDDESRTFNISNNNIGYYDAEHAAIFGSPEEMAPPLNSTLDSWIADGAGAEVIYEGNFQEGVDITDPPNDMVEWMTAWHEGAAMPEIPYDSWNEVGDYLGAPNHYTLDDLRDFYFTEAHDSYTAAESGYPVGDLNWFPELKERWEQGLSAESGCSEEMVVEPDNYPEETGNLNAAIETCLAENPETIFVLERDAVYWLSEGLVVDAHKLHLRAEEGEGHIPIIRPADTSDRLITSDNDFTLEGIYLLGINENGDLIHHVSHNGDNNRIVLDESAMVGNNSTSFILYGENNSLFLTNSIFANSGRTHWDFGRFINPRSADQDTIWVENTTLYNFVHSILMSSDGIDYLYFNHNTAVNAGSNIRTAQAQEAVITNNLYLNLSLRGESGIITASSTDNDASREYKISNNNIGYYEEDYSELFMSVFDQPPVLHPTLQEWLDSGNGANVAFENNFQEGIVFTDPPSNTEMVEWMTAWHQGNPMPDVPPYDKWDEVGDYLGAHNHYTMDDLRDFSYSGEHDSYTAAEKGYPVGDLNWFPELKEQWEQGISLINEVTFANIQSPASGVIEEGEEFIVYARVEAPGFTGNGESEDIQAWIGFHTEDISPDEEGWTWLEAEFNTEYTGIGHEYMAEIGSGLEPSDYFYTSRFQLNSNDYVYGGFNSGFWDGENNVSGQLTVNQATSTDGKDNLPKEFGLQQNYPNPFNPTTNISYQVPQSAHVLIEVYNILGRKVATLVSDTQPAGYHEVTFNGSGLSSGIYIYRMQVDNFVKIRKLVLAK